MYMVASFKHINAHIHTCVTHKQARTFKSPRLLVTDQSDWRRLRYAKPGQKQYTHGTIRGG